MRREGSALNGLGVVMLKELSDHLSSVRMRVLRMAGRSVCGCCSLPCHSAGPRDTTAEDPFLLLRLFTVPAKAFPSRSSPF